MYDVKFGYGSREPPNFISNLLIGEDVVGIVYRQRNETWNFEPIKRRPFDCGRSPCNH
jgi:hypothetical protein